MKWCECRHVGEGIDFANDVISKPEEKRRCAQTIRRTKFYTPCSDSICAILTPTQSNWQRWLG